MEKALEVKSQSTNAVAQITDDQWSLVKRTLVDNDKVKFTDDEFKLFVNQAKRTGLDPFSRQIYATKIGGKVSVQATIDGLRLVAQRSGQFAGQTRPTWYDKDGKEFKVWPKDKGYPYACEIGVLRNDFKEPLYAIAIFEEYAGKQPNFMWAKMPALMISKVAEALALRKAFPNDLSGIYSSEEMAQDMPPQEPEGPKDITPKAATVVDDKEQRISIMVESFRKVGVSEAMLKHKYNLKAVTDLSWEQIDELATIGPKIAKKQAKVGDFFSLPNHAPKGA